MVRPFHYAFLIRDLDATRHFYGSVLGCSEGRWAPGWVDFDFFGNQISMHLSKEMPRATLVAEVDGVEVPMPHFGAVVPWDTFDELASRLQAFNADFMIEPTVRFAGQAGEQKMMFFLDPSGNPIEMKAFRNDAELFHT